MLAWGTAFSQITVIHFNADFNKQNNVDWFSDLKECKKTIVSIFINPRQFNNKKDFLDYPRNNKLDLSILEKLRVNYVFIPNKKDIKLLFR